MVETLAAAVDRLVGVEVDELADAALREEFVELSHEIDRLECRRAALLAAIHRRGVPDADGAASTPRWVQWLTGQRVGEARASLEAGLACGELPLVAKAWAQGEISASAARTICEGRPEGHEDAYAAIEETLVDFAAGHDWRGLQASIAYAKRCADALDDRDPEDRNGFHHSKTGDRWITSGNYDDFSGSIIDTAIHAAMDKPDEHDSRLPEKRRADASVFIHRFFLDHADLPTENGEAPHVSIVLDWDTICAGLPCARLIGPSLSPTQIARVLCDSQITRIITGPQGEVLDVGRASREPNRAMRRAIAARDRGCRFPGCDRRASWCEAHHVPAWEAGGPTSVRTLVLLCSRHHHVVHLPGWVATFDGVTFTVTKPDGTLIGTTENAGAERERLPFDPATAA